MDTPTPRHNAIDVTYRCPHTGGTLTIQATPSGDTQWRVTAMTQHPTMTARAVTIPRQAPANLPTALTATGLFVDQATSDGYISGIIARNAHALIQDTISDQLAHTTTPKGHP